MTQNGILNVPGISDHLSPWMLQTMIFSILHSAYVYIYYSILKAKTYNWLPNTHTRLATTANKKQLGTSHLSLANGHFTGTDAPFVCEVPTASTNKKKKKKLNC